VVTNLESYCTSLSLLLYKPKDHYNSISSHVWSSFTHSNSSYLSLTSTDPKTAYIYTNYLFSTISRTSHNYSSSLDLSFFPRTVTYALSSPSISAHYSRPSTALSHSELHAYSKITQYKYLIPILLLLHLLLHPFLFECLNSIINDPISFVLFIPLLVQHILFKLMTLLILLITNSIIKVPIILFSHLLPLPILIT